MRSYTRLVRDKLFGSLRSNDPNQRGATFYPPGHFYSPLLDIDSLPAGSQYLPFDGVDWWEHIDLRPAEQRAYFADLLTNYPFLAFPQTPDNGSFRYFWGNNWFCFADAFTLSGMVRKERPQRIIEVGSGFSSAVMLDTLHHTQHEAELVFIEPNPDRLNALLTSADRTRTKTLVRQVQEIPLEQFDVLDQQDMLVIDSSHVAKVGSDVTFLLLRVLPRLKPGVLVHFHDIQYPHSYPASWIREGRAWNESLFLRAFLLGNTQFQIVAFNSYAGYTFPDLFQEQLPQFLADTGGSIWIRKIL